MVQRDELLGDTFNTLDEFERPESLDRKGLVGHGNDLKKMRDDLITQMQNGTAPQGAKDTLAWINARLAMVNRAITKWDNATTPTQRASAAQQIWIEFQVFDQAFAKKMERDAYKAGDKELADHYKTRQNAIAAKTSDFIDQFKKVDFTPPSA
ncbi:MAG: hypothetical protein HC848_05330 [Limnobacter sp.]|nr:hypothetical protein [Limnobacter sp.]